MRRRDFLRCMGRNAAGAGLGAALMRSGFAASPPSERVVVGHIGVGGQGNAHVNWFSGLREVSVAALSDVDARHLQATAGGLKKKGRAGDLALYGDFRKLLDRKDIDAVTIATPDHWHALVTIRAFEAGKDVYCEKPLCYTIGEGRAMVAARKKHRRVFQLGTQIHAGENYHRVVELVRSGALGRIHTVRAWKTGGAPYIEKVPDREPPKELNWDLWLGPRPRRSYNPNRAHRRFRYFWDYSGGVYADFWCHISDVIFWSLRLGSPSSVTARGKLNTRGMAETHEWIDVDFEFEKLAYHWTTRIPDVPGAAGRGIGACFEGTKGSLVTDYGSRAIFLDGKRVPGDDLAGVPRSLPRSPGHQQNFIDCVKSRKLTESHLAYAHNMTVPMHLGLVAFWRKMKLRWDGKAERFIDDREADSYLLKPMRAPWSLPDA